MTKPLSDREMINGIQKGGFASEKALSFLYNSFKPAILTFIKRNSGSEEEAIDVYQDAVVATYDNIRNGKFRGESALASYLYSIARFIWLNRLKRKKKEQEILDEQPVVEVEASHLEVVIETERNTILREVLEQLGSSCKDILMYSIYYEYSMKEIREKMGYETEQVARNKKYKCLKSLKEMVNQQPKLRAFLKN